MTSAAKLLGELASAEVGRKGSPLIFVSVMKGENFVVIAVYNNDHNLSLRDEAITFAKSFGPRPWPVMVEDATGEIWSNAAAEALQDQD